MRNWGAVAAFALLAACSGGIVPHPAGPAPARTATAPARTGTPATPIAPVAAAPASPTTATAAGAGLVAGPPVSDLPITDAGAAAALASFRTSCPGLLRRVDASGLTSGSDWAPACDAAKGTSDRDAKAFFARWFESVQVADGKAFATGYYEPEIHGSRTRRDGYDVPVYGRPDDLIDVDLGLFSADLKGKRIRGRVDGKNFIPYYERSEITRGALAGRGLEIAWAADPVELFFLEVQGSGRLLQPDGSVMRIGFNGQNGRDYTGIGKLMRDRGLLAPGEASMQGIMAWLRAHPDEGRAIMDENKSYVFFKELTGAGPLGAMGYPVVGRVSAAADPKFVPLGAPLFLSMDRTDATGLWIAQDTGGAIKGANRIDTFWGAGDDARATAGGMSARGTAFLLLPTGTLARLRPPPPPQ